ncbi:MAG: hypothetical protein JKY36_04270 [Erythrobacter sp.]|nr:hypothetical protein [Erythrobacter sp.]
MKKPDELGDPSHRYKDVLVITIVGPEGEIWKQRGMVVPRVGETVHCIDDAEKRPLKPKWSGVVSEVQWFVVEGAGGMIVNVLTKPCS